MVLSLLHTKQGKSVKTGNLLGQRTENCDLRKTDENMINIYNVNDKTQKKVSRNRITQSRYNIRYIDIHLVSKNNP